MRFFLCRLLPLISAVFGAAAAFIQWHNPQNYPVPILVFGLWYVFAVVILTYRRLPWFDAFCKTLPSFFTLVAAAFAMLMFEGFVAHWIGVGLFALIPYLVLELVFLLARAPARYPVSGLSRLNIAFVVLSVCFLAFGFDGLQIFLRFPPLGILLLIGLWTAGGYVVTSHPTATRKQKERWGFLGALVGIHAGLLVVALPNSMPVVGTVSALLVGLPLRARRYAYLPVPSARTAWVEACVFFIIFLSVLAAARWT